MPDIAHRLAEIFTLRQTYVNGDWTLGSGTTFHPVQDPATLEEIGVVPALEASDVDAAVAAAHSAFASWRKTTAKERSELLRRWFELVRQHVDRLAEIMTLEQGKPLRESHAELGQSQAYIEFFAEEARRLYGETVPANMPDRRIIVNRQPVGVVGVISPWNFPSAMIARKAAAALAAGCTVVVKPAVETPFSALALAVLAEEAGFPAGVFNVVTGRGSAVGSALTSNPLVRKISFTGSTEVGKVLARDSAATLKLLSLELGGSAPFIVFDDADLDLAVKGALVNKFRNAGQTCVAVNRIFVHRDIAPEFERRFSAGAAQLTVGSGIEPTVNIGPLINQAAVESVLTLVASATKEGARVLTGGSSPGGLYYRPTVIADVHDEMTISGQEVFGPVVPISVFDDESEVLERANATQYGLAAYVYTNDYRRIIRMSEALEFGMVGVNESVIATEVAPFGGVKESGYGREGSRHGLEEYTTLKYVLVGGIS